MINKYNLINYFNITYIVILIKIIINVQLHNKIKKLKNCSMESALRIYIKNAKAFAKMQFINYIFKIVFK